MQEEQKQEQTKYKKWYKKWWIVLIILLLLNFKLFLTVVSIWCIWYVWKKEDWDKSVKSVLTISILLICIANVVTPLDSNNETSELKSEQTEKENILNTTDYKIIEEEDISYALARRYSVRVVVNNNPPTKNQIRAISEKIVSDYRAKNADALAIFFYFDKGQLNGAYTLAKAEWAPNGDWSQADLGKDQKLTYKFTNFIDKERTEENLFGLSEEQRKEIFKEIVKCEDQGDIDAMQYYYIGCETCPKFITADMSKYGDKSDELISNCKKKINIDEEILSKISSEGVIKKWTMPKLLPIPDCCK